MSKTKVVLLLAAIAVVAVPSYFYISFVGSNEALYLRFPQVDRDVIYQAHKEIFWEMMRGEHKDVEDDADGSSGAFDKIFWEKVERIQGSQDLHTL